ARIVIVMKGTSAGRALSFGGAAHVARKLDQRFFAMIDVDDLAGAVETEARGSFFLAHSVEDNRVMRYHLDRGIDLLDLDHGRHRPAVRSQEVMDVDHILARHDAADADGLLTERA